MAELKLSGTSIISDASGTPTLNAGVTLNSTFPAGHVIQRSAMKTYSTQTSTAATSASTGLLIFNPTIASLKKANTKVHLQISNLQLSHGDSYSAHVGVGSYIGASGSTPSYTFGQFANSESGGQAHALCAIRSNANATDIFSFEGEQTLTNSVGDSLFYQVTIWTGGAATPTWVNRGVDATTHTGKAIGYCQIMEIA